MKGMRPGARARKSGLRSLHVESGLCCSQDPAAQLRRGGLRRPHPERGSGGTGVGCSAGSDRPARAVTPSPLGPRGAPAATHPSPSGNQALVAKDIVASPPRRPSPSFTPRAASGRPVSFSAARNTTARRGRTFPLLRGPPLAAVGAPTPGAGRRAGFLRGRRPRAGPGASRCGGPGGGARPRAGAARRPAGTPPAPPASPRPWPPGGGMAVLGCELVWQLLLSS